MYENPVVQNFFDAMQVPVRYFKDGRLAFEFIKDNFTQHFISWILPYAEDSPFQTGYIITDEQIFLGFVRVDGKNDFYAMGPTSMFKPTASIARVLLKDMKQNISKEAVLLDYLRKIPAYSVAQSRNMISVLDFLINGKSEREVHYIAMNKKKAAERPLETLHLSTIEHIISEDEKEMVAFVELGRSDLMEDYLYHLSKQGDGLPEVAETVDRAAKNIFILSLGILSRTALRAGVDYDTMSEIQTYFLNKIENQSGYDQSMTLFRRMCMSFTNAVAMKKKLVPGSLTIHKIQQIIFSHMYEKVTPTIIAEKLNMSLSYLCRHFKSETGKTIATYINEIKIEESKRLLITTNQSILDISTQLGFSSSNYMNGVFTKITGTTPGKFRKQYTMHITAVRGNTSAPRKV